MGVFADFLAERPMRIPEEREARREFEALRDQGDSEYPSGFEGRTGWAVLKTLGLTDLAAPPPIGDLLGYLPQDIAYGNTPISPDTAHIIANQIAIDDGNMGLEQDLLIHLDLCDSQPGEMCLNTPAPAVTPSFLPGLLLDPSDYVHRWSADQQPDLSDTDPILTMLDGGSGGVNMIGEASGSEPPFKENIFNTIPAAQFVTPNSAYFLSESDVTLFPAKRGTYIWVGQFTDWFSPGPGPDFPRLLSALRDAAGNNFNALAINMDDLGDGEEIFEDDAMVAVIDIWEEGVGDAVDEGIPQLWIIMRDSDTTYRFRRNGVEKQGATIANVDPGTGTYSFGFWFKGQPTGATVASMSHDVGMVLSYDRVLSPAELTTLEGIIMPAYGIV